MASGNPGLNFQALSGQSLGYRDVTAAGTGQSTATALASYSALYYNVASADGTKGVSLPGGSTVNLKGKFIVVHNPSTASGACPVYPASGGVINGLAANAAFSVAVGATVFFFGRTGNNWDTVAAGGGSGSGSFSSAITITDPVTPSLTTQAGSTNTGFVLINGKTSGSLKITTADATAQAVTETVAAQTVGASTLTIPDQAGVSSNFVFDTLAQTLTNKTLNSPTISSLKSAFSTATVSAGYAADTYLAGSSIGVPTGGFVAGATYNSIFDMVKTAAGSAALVVTLRIGTAASTADAAICTFTFGAGTAAADSGTFMVEAHFRTVGSGTSAVVVGLIECSHALATTGLISTGASGFGQLVVVSSGFNSTIASTFIGLSVNGGASFSGTNTLVETTLRSY